MDDMLSCLRIWPVTMNLSLALMGLEDPCGYQVECQKLNRRDRLVQVWLAAEW